MILAENTVIAGRFRLSGLLGRGGMGSVWRATHLGLDIPCAVKFIEGELASLPEAQSRFEREAKAAAQLRSPHVVQILDHGVCEGTPYIAMELLEGEDLGKRLARVGRLSPRDLYTIVSQVCRALTRAHSVGIVHRDLKPDNIFLVKDDDREIVKVLDFGIAKSQKNDLSSGNTKTGALLGTPYYMSPEQAQGTKQVDFRTDLWALAVICFQCLSGRLPFESEALGDLLIRIIVAPIPVPSQYGPVPPGFDAWWGKAASRDIRSRFDSAREFGDSLGVVCGVTSPALQPEAAALAPAPMPAPGGPTKAFPTEGVGSPMARTIDPMPPIRSKAPVVFGAMGLAAALGLALAGFAVWRSHGASVLAPASATTFTPLPSALPVPAPLPPPSATLAAAPAAASTPPSAPVPAPEPAFVPASPAVHVPPKGAGFPVVPGRPIKSAVAASAPPAPAVVPPPSPAEPPKPAGKPAYDVGF